MTSDRPTVSVLIVDDHPLFGDALARAVRSREDLDVVGVATTGAEALETLAEARPDVCVLDIGLPDISGERVLGRIVADELGTRVLILSGSADSDLVYKMLESGASGFELKTAGPEELCDAIAAVAAGETFLSTQLHSGLAEQIRSRSTSDASLSEREIEILQLVSDGASAHDIGDQLGLAESTVKTHLTRIYDKLGVSERAAAVAQAMRHGLIQ